MPDFVAGQIDAVERPVKSLQLPPVAVVAHEVTQEAARYLGPFRAAAAGHAINGGMQAGGRDLAVFRHEFFDTRTLFARDESVLQLLRVDAGRILRQQRNHFVGGNHLVEEPFAFQQTHPIGQARLLRPALGGGIVRYAASH